MTTEKIREPEGKQGPAPDRDIKQILVISGKGGTGKTVLTGAFAHLAEKKVMADCDVDAANLYLILDPLEKKEYIFKSGATAFIDPEKCTGCGLCREVCRFQAVTPDLHIDATGCEGCAFCSRICPAGAITMKENTTGRWFRSNTRFGPFVHAELNIAEENSGKLVSLVKQKALEEAARADIDLVLIDGAPGIGCPVIASLSGVDVAVVVTEPTLSGLHDAERVIQVARHFNVPVKVVINKYDLNTGMTRRIEKFCRREGLKVLGRIPFDEKVIRSMVKARSVMEGPLGPAGVEITKIWSKLEEGI